MMKFSSDRKNVTVSVNVLARWYLVPAVTHFVGGVAAGIALTKVVEWWVYPATVLLLLAGFGAAMLWHLIEEVYLHRKRGS